MHRWEEEVELLQAESGWVRNYFDHRAQIWNGLYESSVEGGRAGPACYAARQRDNFARLRDHCKNFFHDS